jgi:hypothetical protein
MGTVHKLRTAGESITTARAAEAYLATLASPEQASTLRAYRTPLLRLVEELGSATVIHEIDPDKFAAWFTGQGATARRRPGTWRWPRSARPPGGGRSRAGARPTRPDACAAGSYPPTTAGPRHVPTSSSCSPARGHRAAGACSVADALRDRGPLGRGPRAERRRPLAKEVARP